MSLGAGTLAYGIVAGTLAATALVFVLIAVQRRRAERLFLAFGLFGLAMAINTIVTVWMQKSESLTEYAELVKLLGGTGLLTVLATVGLVQAWTGAIPRTVMMAFLAASAVIAVLQLTLPEGLLAAEITGLREVQLFGETFVVHQASSSPWRPALDLYLLVMFALLLTALWRALRRGPRAEAIALAVGISGCFAVGMYDTLVDEGLVSTPYLAPFGAVFVVVAGAWLLSGRMGETERRLAAQTTQLEATVIDRTAALMDANRQLEGQVARQRASARRLATLAEQFETVNALALRHDDSDQLEQSLLSVLANLGNLLDAEAVTLRVTSAESSDASVADIGWNRTDERYDSGESDVVTQIEPIVIGSRKLGELVVRPALDRELGTTEQRYIELTSGHLAGFLDRLELSDEIAAAAVDAERHRIARELHDSVTQKLYSVSFLAEAVPRQLDADPDQARDTVRSMRQVLLSSLAELRTLLFELQPDALHAAPLPTLIGQLADMFGAAAPISVETRLELVRPLPPDVKVGIYRITQEALSNAMRHSHADVVTVELHETDGTVELVVRDQGVGFDPTIAIGGHGLANVRRRAASLGADLDIESAPGIGTAVVVQWDATEGRSPDARVDEHAAGEQR